MFARAVRNDANFFHWHVHVATDALYLQLPNLWPIMFTDLHPTSFKRVAVGKHTQLRTTAAGNTLEISRKLREDQLKGDTRIPRLFLTIKVPSASVHAAWSFLSFCKQPTLSRA